MTWDVGTVGMTFCIFMAGRKGDLLGDMRLSRERGKEAGLGALEMWFEKYPESCSYPLTCSQAGAHLLLCHLL